LVPMRQEWLFRSRYCYEQPAGTEHCCHCTRRGSDGSCVARGPH
jgi:hypothetical protein